MEPYTINDFKVGDKVYLNSDFSQAMSIISIDVKDEKIKCYWRDKNKKAVNEVFPPDVLCKEDDRPQIQMTRISQRL